MVDGREIRSSTSKGSVKSVTAKNRLHVGLVVFLGLAITAIAAGTRMIQDGPHLNISESLSVGNYRLGLPKQDVKHGSELPTAGPATFVEGKCISVSGSEFLTDGKST